MTRGLTTFLLITGQPLLQHTDRPLCTIEPQHAPPAETRGPAASPSALQTSGLSPQRARLNGTSRSKTHPTANYTMASSAESAAFPCTLYVLTLSILSLHAAILAAGSAAANALRFSTLNIPFPSPTHATNALRALAVDEELSSLVKRSLSVSPDTPNVLDVHYSATTNRMLRVAVNGFFDSLGVVLGVMEELDVDTVLKEGKESVEGAQGLMPVKGSVG